ncbi:ATP-binding domain-containing protein [Lactobacillus amylovorus]
MKGRIINVFLPNLNTITFDIELNTVISEIDAFDKTFKLLGNTKDGKSVIRFSVLKSSSDDDAVRDEEYTMPFNVTYAMSVHKAQGLEFDEVKLVVDGNREENLDINTFYTAITRAKKKLNIFWTPETENDFLKSIQTRKDNSEMRFLYNCYLR